MYNFFNWKKKRKKKTVSYLHGSQRLRRVQLNRAGERETGRGVSTPRASSPGQATAKFHPGALAPVGWSLAESSAKDTSNSVKCGGGFLPKLHKLTKKDCSVVYNKTYSQSVPEFPQIRTRYNLNYSNTNCSFRHTAVPVRSKTQDSQQPA